MLSLAALPTSIKKRGNLPNLLCVPSMRNPSTFYTSMVLAMVLYLLVYMVHRNYPLYSPWSQSKSIFYATIVDTHVSHPKGGRTGIGEPKMHDRVSSSHNCASVLQRTNISLTAPQSFLYFNLLHRGKTYPYIVLHV